MKKREHTDICYVGNVDGICTQLVAFVGAVLYPEIKMCGNLPSPREEGEMMMKKNVASLLLALVLCLSLLPTAALASESATGIYTEINNGAPAGQYTGGSRPAEDGPWGYWDMPAIFDAPVYLGLISLGTSPRDLVCRMVSSQYPARKLARRKRLRITLSVFPWPFNTSCIPFFSQSTE